jgi:hypothetical protein
MTTTEDHNKEVLRKLEQRNKIAEFAINVLGMDERRAEVFEKACGDRFVWDGTLRFKGASGEVPADDPQCAGFFRREYDFLVPAEKVEDKVPVLDPNLIEKAKAGNWTAKSQLFRTLHADKPKGSEGETRKQLDQILAGETPKGGERDRDAGGKFVANGHAPDASNPFSIAGWNVTEQGRLTRKDPVHAARLAKSAGVALGATRPVK